MKNKIIILSSILITIFGLITIFLSGSIIFDLFGIRQMEGNYVFSVVAINFLSGFLYLLSAYGLIIKWKWTTLLLSLTFVILIVSSVFLFFHINAGGLYERKTISAILFRIALTGLFAGISWYFLSKNRQKSSESNKRSFKLKSILFIVLILFSLSSVQSQTFSLNQCIDTALKYNRNIKLIQQDVFLAKDKNKETISNLLPKIHAVADYKYYTNLPYQLMPAKAFGGPEGTYKEVQFGLPQNLNLNLQFNLPLFNATILNSIHTTDLMVQLSEIQRTKTKEDVVLEVSNAYYNAQILSNQLAFIDSNIINSKKLLEITNLLHDQQMIKRTDVDKVELQLAQLQSQRNNTFSQYLQVLNALKFQMGKPLDDSISILTVENLIVVNDYPISTTSDEKLIEKKLELNNSEMKGLKYALLPSLGIYGLYGTTGFGNTGSNSFFNFYEIGFVGIQLNIPLFNGLSTHRKIEQKAIDIEKNTMMKDLLTEKISLETKNAKMQYEVMKKNIETSFKQISLAKSIFDNTVIQSKQGVASVTDILLADNSLRESQQNYIVAMANLRKSELELKRISGNLLNY